MENSTRGLNVSVKNVKSFEGHDGMGFNCTLYYNDKRLCRVYDGAYGGEVEISDLKDKEAYNNLLKAIKQLPNEPSEYFDDGLSIDLGIIVEDLVNDFLQARDIKREQNKGICIGESWNDYKIVYWPKYTLSKLSEHPKGKALINSALLKHQGKNILNLEYINSLIK